MNYSSTKKRQMIDTNRTLSIVSSSNYYQYLKNKNSQHLLIDGENETKLIDFIKKKKLM